MRYRRSRFSNFSNWTARASGHSLAFIAASTIIVGWADWTRTVARSTSTNVRA